MAHHAAIKPRTSLCVQTWHDNPAWGTGSQQPVNALGTAHAPIVRSPTYRPSYTTVTYMQRDRLVPGRLPCCFRLWVQMSQASGFCGISWDVPDHLVSSNPSSLSLAGLAQLSSMFGHGSLNWHLSVTVWWLSHDNRGSQHRGWPVQAMPSLLPDVLYGAILVESWDFPSYLAATRICKAPLSSHVSQHCLPLLTLNLIPEVPMPTCPLVQQWDLLHFPFLGRSMSSSLWDLLVSWPLWVCGLQHSYPLLYS